MRILIVEDDITSCPVMARFVAPWAIAEVAHDGQQALQMIRARMANNEPFDLILLDVMMPILDGQQALAELRQLEHLHGIQHAYRARVVMTTALDDGTSITAATANSRSRDRYHTSVWHQGWPRYGGLLLHHLRRLHLFFTTGSASGAMGAGELRKGHCLDRDPVTPRNHTTQVSK